MSEEIKNAEQGQQKNMMPEEEIYRQRKDKLMRLREEEGYDPFSRTIGKSKTILPMRRKSMTL